MIVLMSTSAMEIAVVAVAIGIVSFVVSKKLSNPARTEQIQEQINSFQKKMKDAQKNNDTAEIKRLEVEQREMLGLMKEMMINNFKPAMVTFLPFIAVWWTLSGVYGSAGNIVELPVVNWQLNWFWWYFVVIVIVSLVFEVAYKQYRKSKKKKQVNP